MTTQNIIEEQKRQLHGIRIRDLLTTLTAAASAIAATGFLFSIAPLSGVLSFVLMASKVFLQYFS